MSKTDTEKMKGLKRESWIQNAMRVLHYTRQQAEEAYNRIFAR